MSRTELQEQVRNVLEAAQHEPDPKRFINLAARIIAHNAGYRPSQFAAFTKGFVRQLEECHRDGVTTPEAVSGRVADWIQDITS